ncbi:MAG: hypothetical protein WCK47_03895 [bacterium]|nr:hypothetical protein [Candidatus Sumerlaeota bacterium]
MIKPLKHPTVHPCIITFIFAIVAIRLAAVPNAAAETTSTTKASNPPVVALRDISNAPRLARGSTVEFNTSVALFLPEGWQNEISPDTGDLKVTIHFHGAQWFAIEEHARRGARHPLIAIYQGEGSRVYQAAFENPQNLNQLLDRALAETRKRGPTKLLRLAPIEVQSFSAGYGAVRELLKHPDYVRAISAIVLADSLYASLTTGTEGQRGQPDPEQMRPFIEYGKLAARGDKFFLLAHSDIATPAYASTVETGDALIAGVGARREQVTTGSLAAAAPDLGFPLLSRADARNFHVWGYAGRTPQAHMAIARTIAEFWHALYNDVNPPA